MFATYVVTSMIPLRETLMAVLLLEQHSKTSLRIGFAPSAESARVISLQWMTNYK